MGFLDKIMDTMHLGSDDYDDDYDDDFDDDYEEERPRRGSVFKKKDRDSTMIWKMIWLQSPAKSGL